MTVALHAIPPTPLNADAELEQGVIGSIVTWPASIVAVLDAGLHPSHFTADSRRRSYEAVVARHVAGQPIDARLIWRDLEDEVTAGTLTLAQADLLVTWPADAPSPPVVGGYALELVELHRRRTTARHYADAANAIQRGDDHEAERHLALAQAVATTATAAITHQTLDVFMAEEGDDYDWVIPGLIERSDRVLITGEEGGGKSTLLRQMAVQCAAGIHPFTLAPMTPLRVLLVDLENSKRQIRRKMRPLRVSAGHTFDQTMLTVAAHPEGLDLLNPDDVAAFTRLIEDTTPDLVLGGPIYKLVGGDPTEEGPAKAASSLLDRLRVAFGFALFMETHQPHETGGSAKRVERPYGASLWKRWPEFGIHIAKNDRNISELRHWRGARDERDWPQSLRRGGDWPWTLNAHTVTFAKIIDATRAAGVKMSLRQLSIELVGDETMKDTIKRAIDNNRLQYDEVCAGLTGPPDAVDEPYQPAAPIVAGDDTTTDDEPDGPSWDDQAGLAGM